MRGLVCELDVSLKIVPRLLGSCETRAGISRRHQSVWNTGLLGIAEKSHSSQNQARDSFVSPEKRVVDLGRVATQIAG